MSKFTHIQLTHLLYCFRFIYTGEVFVPQHELKDFLRTAELLEIKGLLKVKNAEHTID